MKAWFIENARTLRATVRKILRTPLATIFNVIVVGIALALPAGLYLGLVNVQKAVRTVSPEPQLTLFMALDASRAEVGEIDTRLKNHREVARLQYVPRERALEEMKRASGMSGIVEALDHNPLPDAFVIDAADAAPEAMQRLRTELASWPKVSHVQLDAEWAQRLDAVLKVGRIALMLLATVLAFSLVAITFNTIRLQILTQREEIEVTTLIGATDTFIRRPFLYYGAVLGLLGGLAACGFVWAATTVLNDALTDLSYLYGARWEIGQLAARDSLSLLAFAAALGWLGAWLSVGRHLAHVRPR
ncbi:MAG TPA: permease-like cell division protein FtsX [Burkholderiales bacterium]|jgi:cell division transport system permease protein|nr:permease-like cell division protein FtsX [Burkholderiales bacterium]